MYFEAYEAVISMTSGIVAKYQKYGITFARMENPTLEEAARQLKMLAKLLNEGEELGILNGDDVMKSVNASDYAHAIEQISDAFSAGNEEEVHRIISELDKRSIL